MSNYSVEDRCTKSGMLVNIRECRYIFVFEDGDRIPHGSLLLRRRVLRPPSMSFGPPFQTGAISPDTRVNSQSPSMLWRLQDLSSTIGAFSATFNQFLNYGSEILT